MCKVLYIKANVKPEGQSRTFQVSDELVKTYQVEHPADEVVTLDLYKEGIGFLSTEDLGSVFGSKTEESKNHPVLKYAYQFAQADKIIVAAPMWNLGLPAILKAYIDYISVTGISFKYTEQGPTGMLTDGKKVVFVTGRGGMYSEGPAQGFEMGERYLRTIFAFFGITDFQTIAAENLDVQGVDVERVLAGAIGKAREVAKQL